MSEDYVTRAKREQAERNAKEAKGVKPQRVKKGEE